MLTISPIGGTHTMNNKQPSQAEPYLTTAERKHIHDETIADIIHEAGFDTLGSPQELYEDNGLTGDMLDWEAIYDQFAQDEITEEATQLTGNSEIDDFAEDEDALNKWTGE